VPNEFAITPDQRDDYIQKLREENHVSRNQLNAKSLQLELANLWLDEVIGVATSIINGAAPIGDQCLVDKNTLDFLSSTINKIKESRNG
jgi:hypothetical protein